MKSKLSIIIIGIVILLGLVQLMISHSLATTGERVRQLELKADQFKRENALLTEEINKTGSLSSIAKEAQRIGLVKARKVLHLTPEIPVAQAR